MTPRRHRHRLALALALAVALGACGGSRSAARPRPATSGPSATSAPTTARAAGPCGSGGAVPATYDHVVWIWMENHTAADVIGSPDAPYATALARQCGTVARYASVGSPSLPNYIGATSGATQGISDDGPPSSHPVSVDNLFRQVRAARRTERTYAESMSTPCQLDSAGEYAVKHSPAPYYVGGQDRAACQQDDVPLGTVSAGALRQALDSSSLPAFAFVVPNLCNDTHDCPVRTGDDWLSQWVPAILASPEYRAGRTALFVVWDEPTPMPFLAVAPTTPAGAVAPTGDHYALLRTTEELLGLPLLGSAAGAPSLRVPLRL